TVLAASDLQLCSRAPSSMGVVTGSAEVAAGRRKAAIRESPTAAIPRRMGASVPQPRRPARRLVSIEASCLMGLLAPQGRTLRPSAAGERGVALLDEGSGALQEVVAARQLVLDLRLQVELLVEVRVEHVVEGTL